MNVETLKGRWHEMKGKAKERWGKLTDDELDRAKGDTEQLIGLLEKRYGKAREEAKQEVEQFCKACEN